VTAPPVPTAPLGLRIRPARRGDATALHALTSRAYAGYAGRLDPPSSALTETEEQVLADLAAGGALVAADATGQLVGALRFRVDAAGALWVRRVSTDPGRQRRGVATALLAAAEQEGVRRGAPSLRLGVRHALPANRRLYEAAGYRPLRAASYWDELVRPLPVPVPGPEAMRVLGGRLGRDVLRGGDLVLADGPLGAGKTVLAQGIAAGLRVTAPVRSPTYTVVDSHPGERGTFLHVDAWRLGSPEELDDLDLDGELAAGAVAYVEWGTGRAEQLAPSHLAVTLHRGDDGEGDDAEDLRTVRLDPRGGDWAARLDAAGLL